MQKLQEKIELAPEDLGVMTEAIVRVPCEDMRLGAEHVAKLRDRVEGVWHELR